ncbi:hypothetical protein OZL92_10965 [Bacillus sonorensis]|uniref:Uncharacterized protein n=3 Tax=Bacillus sonorensis TaxID=119858 RepID=M5PEK1_9BACI|nr:MULTISPECIES: hypothetical protein [Bacillus]TWK72942.1 hypothetical protein CHCC20335_1607 [Bacillus paralicheniformis]ASB90042.1 hypothetical protein S101395_03535 [Bacillus sonorensis]EME74712.1 hypothetical protein BSONL12_13041 [Bacillus sonorensis L12]MBG9916752.1 hypothetical protein [Bacillus sonorensis]MCF7619291.1 hypothetical protein [Bacillus sonorensis]
MNNSPTTVRALIFQTHIKRLKELMTKRLDQSITKAERRELAKLHDDCIDMMANVFQNGCSLDKDLISKEEAEETIALLHKIIKSSGSFSDE